MSCTVFIATTDKSIYGARMALESTTYYEYCIALTRTVCDYRLQAIGYYETNLVFLEKVKFQYCTWTLQHVRGFRPRPPSFAVALFSICGRVLLIKTLRVDFKTLGAGLLHLPT
mmetsp:Transcript_24224/g.45063  ORF Transcript_24224/g.45063 Transcript_24224/m.45063 type:complete len:114 (+) Transcript_24224:817-1158(+)